MMIKRCFGSLVKEGWVAQKAFESCAARRKVGKLLSVIGQAVLEWEKQDGGRLVRDLEGGKRNKPDGANDYYRHAFRRRSNGK
jgi:hypothetical protein